MGASHAANRAVEPLYRELGMDAVAVLVSEQQTQGLPLARSTVILVSQSGESAEVIRWLQTACEGEVYGMTLDGGSRLGGAVPCLVAAGGAELAFAATHSLTLTAVLHLAILVQLGADPELASSVLRSRPAPDVSAATDALREVPTVVASGRSLQGVAEACALGLCELSRLPAFSLEGGQLRHGPMEIMDPELGVVLLRGDEPTAELVAGMARSAQEAGARVVLFDASGAEAAILGVTAVALPRAQGMAAILSVLPAMQRFMLGFAAQRIADVGTPRRSSKITRRE